MGRSTVTVPAAGESQTIGLTGLSLVVISAPGYSSLEAVPLLSFDDPGDGFPAITGSTFPSDSGEFKKVVVTGTEESAGDEISILSIDLCLGFSIGEGGFGASGSKKVIAGTTFAKTSTDAVQELSDLEIQKDGQLPSAMYIQAKDAQIAFAFDADPDQSGFGYVLETPANANGRNGSFYKIEGLDFIQKFRFISAAAATPGEILITCEY